MPGFDGTGPVGAGPMTGGGRGNCAVSKRRWWRPFGRGFFFFLARQANRGIYRRAASRGWVENAFSQEAASKDEAESLKREAQALREELGRIQERIDSLENK